jgi:hypothetical protein
MSESVRPRCPVHTFASESVHPVTWQRGDVQMEPFNAVAAGLIPTAADLAAIAPHSGQLTPEGVQAVLPLWQPPHATSAAAAATAAVAAANTIPGAQPVFESALYHASGYPHPYAAIPSPHFFFPTTQYTGASVNAERSASLAIAGDAQSRPPPEDDPPMQLQCAQRHVLDRLGTGSYSMLRSVLMAQQLEYRCQVHILQWLLLQHSVLEAQMSSSGMPLLN